MKSRKLTCCGVILFGLTALIGGCSSTPEPTTRVDIVSNECDDPKEAGAPEWVTKESGALDDDAVWGVASKVFPKGGYTNYSLMENVAKNRARNELAKYFGLDTKSFMDDYQSMDEAEGRKYSEEKAEEAFRTVTDQIIVGATIEDKWFFRCRHQQYALAKIDLENMRSNVQLMQQNLESSNQLSESMREVVRKNAKNAMEKLERLTKKGR